MSSPASGSPRSSAAAQMPLVSRSRPRSSMILKSSVLAPVVDVQVARARSIALRPA